MGHWKACLDEQHACKIKKVACEVARRIEQERRLEPTQGFSLSQGRAGIALFYGYLDECFPGEGWDTIAHLHLSAAVNAAASCEHLGLYDGLSGIGFAAVQLSRRGERYVNLLQALHVEVVARLERILQQLSARTGFASAEYDLVAGIAGVAVYLLSELEIVGGSDAALSQALLFLASLSEQEMPPKWHTPGKLVRSQLQHMYPDGYVDCGAAHGAAGILGVLAASIPLFPHEPKFRDAAERLLEWVLSIAIQDEWGVTWPAMLPRDYRLVHAIPARNAWCYGSLGTVATIGLAAARLERPELSSFCADALNAVFRRPANVQMNTEPMICHGLAGTLLTATHLLQGQDDACIRVQVEGIANSLLGAYSPSSRFGYPYYERMRSVDHPGLLEGAVGVVMALLAASTDVQPRWAQMFLLF